MSALMTAQEALQRVYAAMPREACTVVANGYLSREAYGVDDRPGNFYMIGSMGLAGSIGLGAALARPERPIVVVDGDGNVLMGLGALAVIGSEAPKNLWHVCIDNGVYASTGNQPTVAPQVRLEGIAREAGYRWSGKVETLEELERELPGFFARQGPVFLRVMVGVQPHPRSFPRVEHTPVAMRDRFSGALRGASR